MTPFKRLALITTVTSAALAWPAVALASLFVNPTGNYSAEPSFPDTAQSAHFTATSNPSNYDVRVAGGCSDGTTIYGSFHTGTGTESNTMRCDTGGHGHLVNLYKQWMLPPNTKSVSCWVPGVNRNGTC